ncbi:MAG: T9SS type A sorting domain-containing protein [Candidatus Edwardsbacteria bacterium]|nr:T9SS type A sorting domain-containing protein [Candidatus Edwardsbacteria bacterium]
MRTLRTVILLLLVLPGACRGLVIDHDCTDLSQVPEWWIRQARAAFRMTYGHTSHGSQVVTGMDALVDTFPVYQFFDDHDYYLSGAGNPQAPDSVLSLWDYVPGGDLGNPDWVTWAGLTDTMLSNANGAYTIYPHQRNLVMWSWCGQVSWADSAIIADYLSLMSGLELSYPNVTFVYITSHLDGSGVEGNLNIRNEQIRAYCRAHDKLLFDFADIESYDPDGLVNYMVLYGTDGCEYDSDSNGNPWGDANWAQQWVAAHPDHELSRLAAACGDCAHSERLNCILKARAFWWMLARLAGWPGPSGVAQGPAAPGTATAGFRVWPNPVRSLGQLRFSRPGAYRVFNALGQVVAAGNGGRLPDKAAPAGIYFVRSAAGGPCRRLVVIR